MKKETYGKQSITSSFKYIAKSGGTVVHLYLWIVNYEVFSGSVNSSNLKDKVATTHVWNTEFLVNMLILPRWTGLYQVIIFGGFTVSYKLQYMRWSHWYGILKRSSRHQCKYFNMLISFAGLKNPITLMSYVTPIMTVTTAIFSLMLDPWHNLSKNKYFDNSSHIMQSCLLMLLGGALAFFMVRVYTKIFLHDNILSVGCISQPFSPNVVVFAIVLLVLFVIWFHFICRFWLNIFLFQQLVQ